jgi:hypothetical protein
MTTEIKQLEQYWNAWLKKSDDVLDLLHQQTAALTMRQVERLESLQPSLDKEMEAMTNLDENAVACAKGLAEQLGCDSNLRSLVGVLEKAEGQRVQALANKVIVAGRNVQRVIDKNKALIENELAYVNGTITVIVNETQKAEGPYAPRRSQANVLMNQAA